MTTLARLTAREQEVARLLATGHSNREIADTLCISPNTVRTHIQSIGLRLGVTNRIRIAALVHAETPTDLPAVLSLLEGIVSDLKSRLEVTG